jgi:eukaryotic-like serine/threonine-protein kinase
VTRERFQQIEELYHAARGRSVEERAALLAQVDPELRREVESLLAQRTDSDFLERPAIQNAPQLLEDSTLTELVVDASLGPYRIERKIGAGGMGEVYEARDTKLGRKVAIKVLPSASLHDPERLARFQREARLLASVNHPNIATIHGLEESAGVQYLVMELVAGETLAERISKGAVPLQEALRMATQIAEALEAAHARGVIHRDLKPANVKITPEGLVKVLDFGLAKALTIDSEVDLSRAPTLSEEGRILGTPAYMSPEQVRGERLDTRTDLFSFGVVLYEMVTGLPPFRGETSGVIAEAILNRSPVAPVRLNPDLSPKLEEVIKKALEKDRWLRYQSAADIRIDLQRLKRDSDSGRATAATAQVELKPAAKSTRFRWAAAAAAGIVIGLGVGGWLFFSRKAHRLTDKDTIVLADFTNSTGDTVFDETLRQGLSVQLEQSPFLSIVSDQRIQQTLKMMGEKPDAKLTPEIARELCQRTASAAVLDGSIAQIGTQYLLTLKAVNCSSGETLASTEAQANDKNLVLDALGNTASEIRSRLGESLRTVQKFDTHLEQGTTPSLEALKAFSSGVKVQSTIGNGASVPFFKHAIELDPNFALAYARLGIAFTSIGEPSIAAGYTRKAYELRDRTSEQEKYLISTVFHKEVTGNIETTAQSCQLWIQAYPRSEMPHFYLSGAIYPVIGQYEKGVEEGREAVRLNPDFPVSYAFLMFNYTARNRLDEAKAAHEQALGRKLNSPFYLLALYQIAFLQNDAAGMAQQIASSAGQPGTEDVLLGLEADTAAYSGRLRNAREFSRRAMDSAERTQEKELAATYSALSGLREALFGNTDEARHRVTFALGRSAGRDAQYGAALALAYAGDDARAQALTDDLDKRFPEDTIVQFNYLLTLRAKLALTRGKASEAIEILRAATPSELGQTTSSIYGWTALYPVFVRGEAYLAAHQGSEAAAEFQKILDHRGVVTNEPIGALAHLQLGRAYAMQGDSAKAKAAYRDFLTLWKDADPDIPVLKQASTEYAKLR